MNTNLNLTFDPCSCCLLSMTLILALLLPELNIHLVKRWELTQVNTSLSFVTAGMPHQRENGLQLTQGEALTGVTVDRVNNVSV